ncbi:hypothetical protein ScPMuIL_017558 [Solemya velum]
MDRGRRSNAKKDYKKMHEGEEYYEIYKMPDPVITPGRSCTKSPALAAEPFTPTGSSTTPGRKELLGPAKSKVKVETETSTSGINTTTNNNNIDLEMELMEADEIARLTAELQTARKQRELESKRMEIVVVRLTVAQPCSYNSQFNDQDCCQELCPDDGGLCQRSWERHDSEPPFYYCVYDVIYE